MRNKIINGIKGFIIGDALGVPFEFKGRDQFECNGMTGYGTYDQPPGTWSDDTSMTLATIAAMIKSGGKFSPLFTMMEFERWYLYGEYTPYGVAFDIGNTTKTAISKFTLTNSVKDCGCKLVADNGNGALMRMLPIAFMPIPLLKKLNIAREAASITHAHGRSLLACEIFVAVVDSLLTDEPIPASLFNGWYSEEHKYFERLQRIEQLERSQIRSTGYVVDTLEAALWCLRTTDSLEACILKAVNLGGDTDTIAAIAGGLSGIQHGIQGEAVEWWQSIARRGWIENMLENWLETLKIR